MNLNQTLHRLMSKLLLPAALALGALSAQAAPPLKVGYSDWPGWTAWQVAIEKGWFKEAGVDVKFEWFDYSASMDAFAAGKLDAVTMTNGDALVTGSGGGKSVIVMVNDFSNGNDMIVAKPGIKSIKDLKGKKVAVEIGLVDHLLLVNALKKAGLKESDVTLVNAKTNELPQVFTAADIAAIGVWQPVAGEAMKAVNANVEDKPRFLAALRKVSFEAPGGSFRFDDKQNAIIPTYIRRVEKVGGKLQNTVLDTVKDVDQFWKPPKP